MHYRQSFTPGPEDVRQRTVIKPKILIKRKQMPYWAERGWKTKSNGYSGFYRTKYGSWHGWIYRVQGECHFYIYDPPEQLRSHKHWTCFTHQGNKWFKVHFAVKPKDTGSGIMEK